jgi:hypothetical protein
MDAFVQQLSRESWRMAGIDLKVEKQRRADAMAKAQKMVMDAGK